jgi:hypothetical protein
LHSPPSPSFISLFSLIPLSSERLRELKRKDRAEKQRRKISDYQSKTKEEAHRIQVPCTVDYRLKSVDCRQELLT